MKSLRQMPRHYVRFFWMARTLGLDCPAGRALYACHRKATRGLAADRVETLLVKTRQSTAERWLQRWREGGTIYSRTQSIETVRAGWKAQMRAWRAKR